MTASRAGVMLGLDVMGFLPSQPALGSSQLAFDTLDPDADDLGFIVVDSASVDGAVLDRGGEGTPQQGHVIEREQDAR
jgi:hypothetical protein